MKMTRLVIVSVSLMSAMLFSPPAVQFARADLTVKEFMVIRDTSYFNYYISGLYQGFRLANSSLSATNRKMLFCVPDAMTVDSAQLGSLLEDTIHAHQFEADVQVEPILLMALQETFSCSN